MDSPTAERHPTTPVEEVLLRTRVRPDQTPDEAALVFWQQIAALHDLPPRTALTRLRALDRVLLIAIDAAGLTSRDMAVLLQTDVLHIRLAHAGARRRAGLPHPGSESCPAWTDVRQQDTGHAMAVHALIEHVPGCARCAKAGAAGDPERAGERPTHPDDAAVAAPGRRARWGRWHRHRASSAAPSVGARTPAST